MKCSEVKQQIDFFIDDELNQSLGDKVEQHLMECPSCDETFECLQAFRRIIRKDISVPDSARLDGRVLEAFSQHQENKQRKNWRTFGFGQIVIPKPALALALLTFAVFTGLAFQLGKLAGTDVRIEMPTTETANLPPQASETQLPSKSVDETANKTAGEQLIKFIEVPVVKEKIITRVVYINKQSATENTIKSAPAKSKANNFALNSSVNENRFLTQVNLKQFQPVAEMKVKIIKKDENYEK